MKKSALILLLFLLMQLVCAAAAVLLSNADTLLAGVPLSVSRVPATPTAAGLTLLAGDALLVGLLWATGLVRRRMVPAAKPWRAAGWPLALPAVVALAVAESLLLAPLGLDDGGTMARYAAMLSSPPCLLLLMVAGPVCEECVFREGVLRQLRESGLSARRAVLVSALLFAVVHGNPAQAVPALAAGLVFGFFYVSTGDVRLCAAAHILHNSLAVVSLAFPGAETAAAELPLWAALPAGLCLLAAAAVLLCLWRRRTAGLHPLR